MDNLLNIIYVVLAVIALYFIYKWINPYFVRIDNIFFVSGAPGTGKDVVCSTYAIKRYKVAYRYYKMHKFLDKFRKNKANVEMPHFYSSIPILIHRGLRKKNNRLSEPIRIEMFLLKERPSNGSIIYISDINRMLSQWSYSNPNIVDNVSEFITEFRQYTKGGYFICNAQSSGQVAKEIRNCFGSVLNLVHHHSFLCFHWSEARRITMSEDVRAVEQGNNDSKENKSNVFLYLNPFFRRYDTYAYYGRVVDIPISASEPYKKANTNIFISLPDKKEDKLVCGVENWYTTSFYFSRLTAFMWLIFGMLVSFIIYAFLNFVYLIPVWLIVWLLMFTEC